MNIENDINAYADWTRTIWEPQNGKFEETDLTVISLGFGGEAGEIMEVVAECASGSALDIKNATKEMGDLLFYWGIACCAFDIKPSHILDNILEIDGVVNEYDGSINKFSVAYFNQPVDLTSLTLSALELSSQVGKIQEILKKRVRDNHFNISVLSHQLGAVLKAWCSLSHNMGLSPSAIALANYYKIEDRKNRGVLLGSGNDR